MNRAVRVPEVDRVRDEGLQPRNDRRVAAQALRNEFGGATPQLVQSFDFKQGVWSK